MIVGDEEFERAFDTFELLLAMRNISDGGSGVPAGQYAHRGQRSFVGRGAPERMRVEIEREGSGWQPLAAGLFDGREQADAAMSELLERLAKLNFD